MNSLRDTRSNADKTPVEKILDRVVKLQWWLLLCLGVAGGVFYYQQPIREPKELLALIDQAKARKAALTAEHRKVTNRIDWLKSEPEYLEIAVRDALRRKKEGETILRFQQQ